MPIDEEIKAKVESMSEIEIYFMVEECGAFLWRMNHDMAHGRIEKEHHPGIAKDMGKMREIQRLCVDQLPRFGIGGATEGEGKSPTKVYWDWYNRWNHWHKHEMTDEQWAEIERAMRKGDDLTQFTPFGGSSGSDGRIGLLMGGA